jgi:hypothetical protein
MKIRFLKVWVMACIAQPGFSQSFSDSILRSGDVFYKKHDYEKAAPFLPKPRIQQRIKYPGLLTIILLQTHSPMQKIRQTASGALNWLFTNSGLMIFLH